MHYEERSGVGMVQHGVASWYGKKFHGNPTASGEIYDMYHLTAAHRTLPLGTYVMVTNLENNRSVEVKINDRGPFVKGRIIDLSYAAARSIDMVEKGTARVRVAVLKGKPLIAKKEDEGFGRGFTVQVGAFSDKGNAVKLTNALGKEIRDVYISVFETPMARYYRVRVGHFNTRERAYRLAAQLADMGYSVLISPR
ncbi:MAG: septal ring lytic transglycosylase RlpA family protein [Thermodesulfobacteriota bacterium]